MSVVSELIGGGTKTYLSCAETAKLVRNALKFAFPGVKFSVRSDSYAGGASMRVKWTDGPTGKEVDSIVKPYAGSAFDGMQDLKYSYSHWLMPDGTVTLAKSFHNLDGGERNPKPSPDAVLVHFGADYVFTEREFSAPLRVRLATEVFEAAGLTLDPASAVSSCADGGTYWAASLNSVRVWDDWLTTHLHRASVGLRGDGTRTHDIHGFELPNPDLAADAAAGVLG